MKTLLMMLLAAGVLAAYAGEAPRRCMVCNAQLGSAYYIFNSPTLGEKQPACEACAKLKERCAMCKLPVLAATARKLDDGRWFCERDFRSGVFDAAEARRIYEEVRREVAGILAGYGILPESNIAVDLANGTELRKLQQTLPSMHDGDGTLGLTCTEVTSRRQFRHHIHLITGLPRGQLAAVCAHEYTHAWLHENLAADRRLEKDSIEGFCELIAYKLVVQRHDEQQRKAILANAYTRGQINAFVEAENQHHFHRIVKWMQTGVDDALVQSNKVQTLAIRGEEPAAPAWPPPAAVPTRVPDSLRLKGISGSAARRFALINDATLTKNEEGRVRVGTSNVVVRCLDIRAGSVVIQIRGAARPTELSLTNND